MEQKLKEIIDENRNKTIAFRTLSGNMFSYQEGDNIKIENNIMTLKHNDFVIVINIENIESIRY